MIPTLLLGCHLYGYAIHSSDVVLISNDTFDDMSECLQCCVTLPKCNFYTATLLQGLPEDLYWCYCGCGTNWKTTFEVCSVYRKSKALQGTSRLYVYTEVSMIRSLCRQAQIVSVLIEPPIHLEYRKSQITFLTAASHRPWPNIFGLSLQWRVTIDYNIYI